MGRGLMDLVALMLALVVLALASGCATTTAAVPSGRNTALDGVDLVAMTDQMARSLAAEPRVNEALAKHGKLSVVVQPVENHLTGEVLPAGQAEAFTARVRMLLSKHAPEKFTWVMNRDAYYRLRQKELEGVDLGPAPEAVSPEYALVARFRSITDETLKRRTASYLCVYELSNIHTRDVIWADQYEVRKVAVKGFLD